MALTRSIHLAAIPSPGLRTIQETFSINIESTYNVFAAATLLGLPRVVWASSETTLGLPFGDRQNGLRDAQVTVGHHPLPDYAPIDEDHPLRPHSSYALSKVLGEEMARQFARWSGIPFVALRFSHVHLPADYQALPTAWADPRSAEWNLWGYVDARDVAQSCRLALTADITGAESFIIAAGDTKMGRSSRDLMAEYFPQVPLRDDGLGEHQTLLSIDKARAMLGYDPAYSWRGEIDESGSRRS